MHSFLLMKSDDVMMPISPFPLGNLDMIVASSGGQMPGYGGDTAAK